MSLGRIFTASPRHFPTKMKPSQKKSRTLFIGVPCHDNRWHVQFGISLIRLANSGLFNLRICKLSGGGVAKARNSLASMYLANAEAGDRMMFIDSDIEFEPGMVEHLWNRDLDIVGGLYCHKKPGPPTWSANALREGSDPDPKTGLQKLAAIGTGFMMVKRTVYERMAAKWPEIRYIEDFDDGRGEVRYDFFPMGVVHEKAVHQDPTYLTEDWYFFYRARQLGFSVYADNGFYVKHWDGATCYPTEPPPPVSIEEKALDKANA